MSAIGTKTCWTAARPHDPLPEVVGIIVHLTFARRDQPYAVFIDNNLGSRPDYLRELCQALQPLRKIWTAAVSIDVTDDHTLVREMAMAGCTGGVRQFPHSDSLPCDTAVPTNGSRGTPAAPRLEPYDTAHAVFRPRHMTAEELERGYAWMYRRLFSHASIWRRRPEDWRGSALSGDVVLIQAVQPVLALPDSETSGTHGVASLGGVDAAAAFAFSGAPGEDAGVGQCGWMCGVGGSVGAVLKTRVLLQSVEGLQYRWHLRAMSGVDQLISSPPKCRPKRGLVPSGFSGNGIGGSSGNGRHRTSRRR